MNTKIVYALVSNYKDFYLEQAYVSIASVRFHMPNAYIVVVVDQDTNDTIVGDRLTKLKDVNQIINIGELNGYTQKQRSRIVKTSLRRFVEGDFLFIDTDTIICRPFPEFNFDAYDIYACHDSHSFFIDNPYREMCLDHGHKLDWPIENVDVYHNSGVIYVKDTTKSHEFYKRWNENWLKGLSRGVEMDQPAFALTNYEFNGIVGILPDIWNCEILHGVKYLKDAYIVHYLTTSKSQVESEPIFLLKNQDIFLKLKDSKEIPQDIVDCFSNPFNGIPSLTTLLSGKEVYIWHNQKIQELYFLIQNPIFRIIINGMLYIKRIISKIVNK
jgi:hypothetical protein